MPLLKARTEVRILPGTMSMVLTLNETNNPRYHTAIKNPRNFYLYFGPYGIGVSRPIPREFATFGTLNKVISESGKPSHPPWSSGKDPRLSRAWPGFDSPWGRFKATYSNSKPFLTYNLNGRVRIPRWRTPVSG